LKKISISEIAKRYYIFINLEHQASNEDAENKYLEMIELEIFLVTINIFQIIN